MDLDYIIALATLWHVLLLCLNDVTLVTCDVIATTDKGQVRGFSVYPNGKHVDVFLGIPFAKPPLGELRFKPPVQLDPWVGVRDATNLPASCVQSIDTSFGNFSGSTMWNANTLMSEDCLYLSVWVPRTTPPYRNKSVIVWIYGGGFYSGSSTLDIYNPNYLAAENDIIVVSMQYRVGALGFLALDTSEASGNSGLWDQRMALEWVSRNIHYFGGNPHEVTLMGESAGAVSVGFHLLCDVCRGYFKRAILQSGAPQVKWGALPKTEIWRRSLHLASIMGCDKNAPHPEIVRCLRKKNATDFPDLDIQIVSGIIQFAFVPIVDGHFLRQDPKEMLRKGDFKKIPLLLGSNSNEATFFLIYMDDRFNRETDSLISSSSYRNIMEQMFNYYPHYPLELNQFGKDAIMFHYVDWVNSEDKVLLRDSIDRAVSDCYFVCAVNALARAYAERDQPVYYYWFDQRWTSNPWPEWMGVLHADEIWYTFGHPLNESHAFTKEERDLSRKMMTYWTNFAKTGDPNQDPSGALSIEWPRFRHDEQLYLNISANTMATGNAWGQGPRTQSCAFWDIYLPKLVAETSDISEAEREWKLQFHEWRTRYIVDWKTQFDNFLYNYQRRMGSCGGRP